MNKVIEIGRLGRDPELTYGGAHKDTAICKFTMAVDRPTEGTDWIRIIAFGKNAENCNKYLFLTKPNSGGHQEEHRSESVTDAFIGVDEDLPF